MNRADLRDGKEKVMSDGSSDAVTAEQLLQEGAALRALGLTLLGDAALADDLVQEA